MSMPPSRRLTATRRSSSWRSSGRVSASTAMRHCSIRIIASHDRGSPGFGRGTSVAHPTPTGRRTWSLSSRSECARSRMGEAPGNARIDRSRPLTARSLAQSRTDMPVARPASARWTDDWESPHERPTSRWLRPCVRRASRTSRPISATARRPSRDPRSMERSCPGIPPSCRGGLTRPLRPPADRPSQMAWVSARNARPDDPWRGSVRPVRGLGAANRRSKAGRGRAREPARPGWSVRRTQGPVTRGVGRCRGCSIGTHWVVRSC